MKTNYVSIAFYAVGLCFVGRLLCFADQTNLVAPINVPPFTEKDNADLSELKGRVESLKRKLSPSEIELSKEKASVANAIHAYNNGVEKDKNLAFIMQGFHSDSLQSMSYVVIKHLNIDEKTLPLFIQNAQPGTDLELRSAAINRLATVVNKPEISKLFLTILDHESDNPVLCGAVAEILIASDDKTVMPALVKYLYKENKLRSFGENYVKKYYPARYNELMSVAGDLYPKSIIK